MKLLLFTIVYFYSVHKLVTSEATGKRAIEQLGIKVECASNCNPAYSEVLTVLRVMCTMHAGRCPKGVRFSWSVMPHPNYFIWERDATPSADGRELKIAQWAFLPDTKVSFMALAEGQSGGIDMLFVKRKNDHINLHCLRNCVVPEPNKDTMYKIDCSGCLANTYIWEIYPTPKTFSWNENVRMGDGNETITILADTFKDNFQTHLLVSGENKHGKRLFTAYKLKFVFHSAVISIKCLSNCDVDALADDEVKLQAICSARCIKEKYVWTIKPETPLIKVSEKDDQMLTILPHAYLGGVYVNVSVNQNGTEPIEYFFTTKGNCSLQPEYGFSGVTKFYVVCSYTEDVEMSVFQHIPFTESYEKGVLLFEGKKISKTPFMLSEGEPTNVTVVVKQFSGHIFQLQATVKEMPVTEKYVNIEKTLKEKILGTVGETLPSLLKEEKYPETIQLASLILTSLHGLDNEPFKEHYSRHVIEQVTDAADKINPAQLITLLVKAVEEGPITDSPTMHLVAEALNAAVEKVEKFCCNYTDQELRNIGHDALLVLEHLSTKSKKVESQLLGAIGNDAGSDYPLYDDVEFNRAKALYNQQVLNHFIANSLQAIGHILDKNGNPLQFQYHNMTTSSQWLSFQPEVVTFSKIDSYLNISRELASELSSKFRMLAQVASISPNPFWWHPISQEIHSELLMVTLNFDDHKAATSLDNYLDLYIDTYDEEESLMPVRGVMMNETVMSVYKFGGEAGAKLDIIFNHIDDIDYYVHLSMSYPSVYEIKEKGYRVSARRRNKKSLIMTGDYIYLGVARYLGVQPTYEIRIKMTKCVSWSDEEREWNTKHCRVGGLSTGKYTHCQCNHLSLFAASVTLPPNKIVIIYDLSIKEMIVRSSLVLLCLTIMILLWGLLMIWAHHRDNAVNKTERTVNVPVDTIPGDHNVYFLNVETGMWLGSGCTARVAIQLIGENGKSRVHLINGPNLLQRGAEDWFAIYTIRDLGKLRFLHLFHDSTGLQPHWYCERVTVNHPATHRIFVFIVQKWLSLVWADGEVERYISVAPKKEQLSGKVLLPHNAKTQLQEEHIWMSMFLRPPGSNYTSKERVSVAFTMALLSILTSAMFYGLGNANSLEPQSTFNVAVREIVIVIKSLLLTLPIGFLLVVLFKKSAPFELQMK